MEAKFNPRGIKPTFRLFALLVYVVVAIIASVGAINYGIDSKEWIYTVAGVINLLIAGYTAIKNIINNTIFNTEKK